MPKIKSNRSAAKRFAFSKTGKVKHKRANLRHLALEQEPGTQAQPAKPGTLNKTDTKTVRVMLPYL